LNKASVHCCPLAEYGDTPHIYKVIEKRSDEERDGVVREAVKLTQEYKRYNAVLNNCEHAVNMIANGKSRSHLIEHALWCCFRVGVTCVGLVFLTAIGSTCYSTLCINSYPVWALIAYHIFTSVPVGLHGLSTYCSVSRSVWQKYAQAIIDRDDCYHLLTKECCRAIFGGGSAITIISLMPKMIVDTKQFVLASLLCIFAYMASDIIFGLIAQLVMRLVLVDWRLSARAWFRRKFTKKNL